MIKINLSDEVLKEDKVIIEDLIVAAHNNAKSELKSKEEEIKISYNYAETKFDGDQILDIIIENPTKDRDNADSGNTQNNKKYEFVYFYNH